MPINWEAAGVLVALAIAIGGVASQFWRGGRMHQQFETMTKDVEGLKAKVAEHDDELSDGRVRFVRMEGKIDQVNGQLGLVLDHFGLASRKD